MSANTAKVDSRGRPQAHLPSINSLELIHSLLDNLMSCSKERKLDVRPHLSQVLIFFWCPKELSDERRLFYLEILPELQLTCLSYGAEMTVVDPFEWYDWSIALQPDMVNLFLQELTYCKNFSGGPFFMAVVCDHCNTLVLPPVLAEEVVSQLSDYFSENQSPFVLDDLYQSAEDAVGQRCYKLKTFDSIGQRGFDTYARLCQRLRAYHETEPNGPWLSKIFPYLHELIIAHASEGEKHISQRSLVVCKKGIAVTQFASLHQNEGSPCERLSPVGSQHSSGLLACDVEILMAPLPHLQTLNDSLSNTTKQSSLDSYLRRFYYRVSANMKCKIQAALDLRHSEDDEHQLLVSFKEDSIVHRNYALDRRKDIFIGQADLIGQVKTAFENVNAGQRSIVLVRGSHGQGKTTVLCHVSEIVTAWMDVGCVIVRFARLTPLASTIQEMLLGCCLELCQQFKLEMDLPDLASKYSTQQIFDWLETCCDQVAYKTCGKPVALFVDDIHRLKENSSISDSKLSFWLPPRLPPNMLFLATLNDEVSLDERSCPDVVTWDYVLIIPPLSMENCRILYERLKDKRCECSESSATESYIGDLSSCPLAVQMLAEMPATIKWLSVDQMNEANVLAKLTAITDARLRMAEHRCGPSVCRFALCFIECARFGLTLGELLDLLTFCEPGMLEVISTRGNVQEIFQFPLSVWLKLKQCLGCLLEEVVCDGRSVYKWSHLFVIGVIRRRYLCTVQHLKDCHMSLVALFNNTLPSAEIVEPALLNAKLRPVMPRPLVCTSHDGRAAARGCAQFIMSHRCDEA
ncbi:NACHT domain containing protein [Trichuris trichiura]|uniref:NACHT domain containing protein n=1 Tax=Trichuris trichiura TaxID=36087 RepID=A0A077ZDW7_TRITR|nr:NACHT domain containing protein [Trichuris trichiura]